MSLEAALRRDDEPKFLDEDESVHYHVTKAGTVVCKSVALVTLPRDHEMKHLDVVVWFDGEGDSQVEMGPAEITHGLREGEEDWIALENLRKQTVQPMVGKSGRKEYVVRIYSWILDDSVQLFSSEKAMRAKVDGKKHHIFVRVKACGTEGTWLFGIKHGKHQKLLKKHGKEHDEQLMKEAHEAEGEWEVEAFVKQAQKTLATDDKASAEPTSA